MAFPMTPPLVAGTGPANQAINAGHGFGTPGTFGLAGAASHPGTPRGYGSPASPGFPGATSSAGFGTPGSPGSIHGNMPWFGSGGGFSGLGLGSMALSPGMGGAIGWQGQGSIPISNMLSKPGGLHRHNSTHHRAMSSHGSGHKLNISNGDVFPVSVHTYGHVMEKCGSTIVECLTRQIPHIWFPPYSHLVMENMRGCLCLGWERHAGTPLHQKNKSEWQHTMALEYMTKGRRCDNKTMAQISEEAATVMQKLQQAADLEATNAASAQHRMMMQAQAIAMAQAQSMGFGTSMGLGHNNMALSPAHRLGMLPTVVETPTSGSPAKLEADPEGRSYLVALGAKKYLHRRSSGGADDWALDSDCTTLSSQSTGAVANVGEVMMCSETWPCNPLPLSLEEQHKQAMEIEMAAKIQEKVREALQEAKAHQDIVNSQAALQLNLEYEARVDLEVKHRLHAAQMAKEHREAEEAQAVHASNLAAREAMDRIEAMKHLDAENAKQAKELQAFRAINEAKALQDQKAALEAKALHDAKAINEAKALQDQKAALEAKALHDAKAINEAKALQDEKAALEAKALHDAQARELEQAANAAAIHEAAKEATSQSETPAGEVAPMHEAMNASVPDAPMMDAVIMETIASESSTSRARRPATGKGEGKGDLLGLLKRQKKD